jgi:hypothetical protein
MSHFMIIIHKKYPHKSVKFIRNPVGSQFTCQVYLDMVPNNHLAYQAIKENVTLINIIEHTNRNMDHRTADL